MITEAQMAVKLLYSLDSDSKTKFVVKPAAPFKVSVHADFGIGFCRLDKCLDYMVVNCNELSKNEFSVFSADFSEENAPLLGHGRLSQLTKSVETVSGKIKENLLKQQIFEVQLHFKKIDEHPVDNYSQQRAQPQQSLPRRMPPSSPPAAKRHHTAPANEDFISNSFNPLDTSIMRQSHFPRKRAIQRPDEPVMPRYIVPRCDNCRAFESAVWRWGPEGEVLCNPCGLWPKTHRGEMRPEKCWLKKKESYPERWKAQLYRRNPGDEPYALYELTSEEIGHARTDPPYETVGGSNRNQQALTPEKASTPEPPSTPFVPDSEASKRQAAVQDKENIPPAAPSTPPRPPPFEIVGNESHHKWMQRFIEGNNDGHDLFEAFMRSPSKQPTRQLDFEISSALSSSPPSSSSNVFDVSEQDLASIGTDWIFRTPEKSNWAHSTGANILTVD